MAWIDVNLQGLAVDIVVGVLGPLPCQELVVDLLVVLRHGLAWVLDCHYFDLVLLIVLCKTCIDGHIRPHDDFPAPVGVVRVKGAFVFHISPLHLVFKRSLSLVAPASGRKLSTVVGNILVRSLLLLSKRLLFKLEHLVF